MEFPEQNLNQFCYYKNGKSIFIQSSGPSKPRSLLEEENALHTLSRIAWLSKDRPLELYMPEYCQS